MRVLLIILLSLNISYSLERDSKWLNNFYEELSLTEKTF